MLRTKLMNNIFNHYKDNNYEIEEVDKNYKDKMSETNYGIIKKNKSGE